MKKHEGPSNHCKAQTHGTTLLLLNTLKQHTHNYQAYLGYFCCLHANARVGENSIRFGFKRDKLNIIKNKLRHYSHAISLCM